MICDVLVIGGGVSGLAAAYELLQRGHDVRVVERQVNVGGNAISSRFDGFLMEHGPSTMNAAVPEGLDFVRQLGLASSAIDLGKNVRHRYLLDNDKLHGISTHPFGFLFSNYLSLAARFSIMTEILRPPRADIADESIHDFVSRRFGAEFSERVMDPLAAGLFSGDARELSVAAVFPKLVEFECIHGSITRAILAAKRGSEPGRRLFSWPHGIATLPKLLAQRLGSRIRSNTAVKRLRATASGFETFTNAGSISSKAVVLAVQPHVAASLLDKVTPEVAAAAGAIVAPPLAVVFLGYRVAQVAHPLDGLGYLSTKSPHRLVTGAQFCSTMFSGRAPEGHVSIAAYVGGTRRPETAGLAEADLVGQVESELSELLGITGPAVVRRIRRWPLGLPQYCLGHRERLADIVDAHRYLPGLYLTGNYIGGVSVANCLKTARETASSVNLYLHGAHRNCTSMIGQSSVVMTGTV